jgi:hypothetical protein
LAFIADRTSFATPSSPMLITSSETSTSTSVKPEERRVVRGVFIIVALMDK